MTEKTGPLMDVTAIEAILPHRYPFLLVDRVVSIDVGKKLVAVKGVTDVVRGEDLADNTARQVMRKRLREGHPVMPGVLILEALAQAGGLLVKASLSQDTSDKVTYLMAIDNARFRRPVVPGDRLELQVVVTRHKGAVWKQTGKALVDGEVGAEAEGDEAAFRALPAVQAVRRVAGGWQLVTDQVHLAIPALLAALAAQGRAAAALSTHRATLEDVFVTLTGRRLRD